MQSPKFCKTLSIGSVAQKRPFEILKVKIKFCFAGEAVDTNNTPPGQRISFFSISSLSVENKYRAELCKTVSIALVAHKIRILLKSLYWPTLQAQGKRDSKRELGALEARKKKRGTRNHGREGKRKVPLEKLLFSPRHSLINEKNCLSYCSPHAAINK